jgi:hypothetical protein
VLIPIGVRKAVQDVDREVALLAGHASEEGSTNLAPFRKAWGRLMDLMVFGPSAEHRKCPHCGNGE